MNSLKTTITLLACCVYATLATSVLADFVGVSAVIKDDPDTEFFCTQGNGEFVPGPLTVCNVFAVFDDPADLLLGVAEADLQVYNGESPDVFYHNPINALVTAPSCFGIEFIFPDMMCDTFITIGFKCAPGPFGRDQPDQTGPDSDWDPLEFAIHGHVVGGWFNATPTNGQGDAGTWPDLQVLFLQSSVAQGLSLSGVIHIIWEDGDTGDSIIEHDVRLECAAVGQEPCECVKSRVTLCHIPPGNRANARTITVGCAAGEKHLAHGDTCGPCE